MNVLWNHISPILTLLVFHWLAASNAVLFPSSSAGCEWILCVGGSLGDKVTSNIPRVKLKFCTFCPTELTAQTDSQGTQGKISIEDFLGIE